MTSYSSSGAPIPPGSHLMSGWAAHQGLGYQLHPDESWFRRWEPYDTIAPPSRYLNACSRVTRFGHIAVVEPWYAADDMEPLERTLLGYAVHSGLVRRAAMRVGEYFLTRVAFIESPPPPEVRIGDAVWDEHVKTFAASPSEAATAFHPRLRQLLASWGFQGHIELRAGGVVVYVAGVRPEPTYAGHLLDVTRKIVETAADYSR